MSRVSGNIHSTDIMPESGLSLAFLGSVPASDWLLDIGPMLTVFLTSGEQADDLFPSQVVGDDIHLEVPARHAVCWRG